MKLPFSFKTSEAWQWPNCGIGNPKTLSFRVNNGNNMLKTLNSAYHVDEYSMCSESPAESFSSSSTSEPYGGDYVENVIRGLRSERLFFEPGGARSSKLLEEEEPRREEAGESSVFKESVEMEIASSDPFVDFRRSMEEMVEAHGGGFHDWKFLEELLACYLRINGKTNHGYIVGAFVDLLAELFMDQTLANDADEADTIVACSSSLASSSSSSSSSFTSSSNTYGHCLLSSSSTTHSFTSPLSFCSTFPTSPSLSLLEEAEDEIEKSIDNASSSSPSPSHPV